jgi:predicted peptidase
MKKFLFFLFLLPVMLHAQMQATKIMIPQPDGKDIPAIKYLPKNLDTAKKYPLVVFLHGAGCEGDGSEAQLSKLLASQNHASVLINGDQRGFIVLAPQYVPGFNGWKPDWYGGWYVNKVTLWGISNLPVDPTRIYLTGLSSGGGGTWDACIRDSNYTKLFAAIIPVCPAPQEGNWSLIAKFRLPVWAFHANNDGANPVTATMNPVNTLNNIYKITPAAKMTIFPSGGHGIWGTVYSSSATWDWLLAQKKSSVIIPNPPDPPVPPLNVIVGRFFYGGWELIIYADGSTDKR